MEYKGKLYGKVGNAYLPLLSSTDDFERLEKENKALKLRKRSDELTLLEKYTNFLLEHCYCDTDVYSETPTAIDEFMKGQR